MRLYIYYCYFQPRYCPAMVTALHDVTLGLSVCPSACRRIQVVSPRKESIYNRST